MANSLSSPIDRAQDAREELEEAASDTPGSALAASEQQRQEIASRRGAPGLRLRPGRASRQPGRRRSAAG